MARHHLALPLLSVLLLAACPRSERSDGPAPVAMTPSQGTGIAALPVTIVGDHFEASAQTDFGAGSGTLATTFLARLLPEGGGAAVDLQAVALTADRKLAATVPAGIARGVYGLEVTDPAGRVGVLANAFRVYSAPENVTSFRVEPAEAAHAGVPFLVNLTAIDGAGAVVDGFGGNVTVSDLTGSVAPTTAGPFVAGRLQARLTITTVTGADRVTVTDALGHAGTSAAFEVTAGPPVALAWKSGPTTLAAGACSALVTLELRDSVGNPSPATAAVGIELQAGPPASLAFHVGGGGCNSPVTSVSISSGLSTATFRYTGPAPLAAQIRAVPAGLPSTTTGVTLTP